MYLRYLLQNVENFDKIWYVVFRVNLPQSNIDVSRLTWIVSLHYLVKLVGRFVLMLENNKVD